MRHLLAVAAMTLGGLGITGCQHTSVHDTPQAQSRYGKSFERYAGEMNAGMQKMMHDMHAPGYTGDADIDFLGMMIPHHEGAVDMARLVLRDGTDPVTRKLAEEILASQRVEIEGRRVYPRKKSISPQLTVSVITGLGCSADEGWNLISS